MVPRMNHLRLSKTYSTYVCSVCTSLGLLASLHLHAVAALIASETFESTQPGPFSTSNQGDLHWEKYGGEIVSKQDLSYRAGELVIDSGNHCLWVNNAISEANYARFSFPDQSGDIYICFVARIQRDSTIFFQPYVDNGNPATPLIAAAIFDTRKGDLVSTRFPTTGPDITNAKNRTVCTLIKLSKQDSQTYNRLQATFNPTSQKPRWDIDLTRDTEASTIRSFGLRLVSAYKAEGAWIDTIRIGTKLSDVFFKVPEPVRLGSL